MKKLIIAEKPSVAREIARAIGNFETKNNYLENNIYIISWCVGHLIENAYPEHYNETYKKWDLATLPFIPDEFKTMPIERTKDQFNTLKKLIEREDVSELICATDSGREGELIFGLIYQYLNCQKPYQRLWISSFEDEVIKNGMANLLDGKEKYPLLESALCRMQSDYLVGINATRLMTSKYNVMLNVGRVQSPTLNLICERDNDIKNFTPKEYFIVSLILEGFKANLRVDKKELAKEIKTKTLNNTAIIKQVEKKSNKKSPSPLFNLTSLQQKSNQLFNYSAQRTLDIAQNLYEKKWLTYPRTDSNYLSKSQTGSFNSLLKKLVEEQKIELGADFSFDSINIHKAINDDKVSDHHAILITSTALNSDWSTLPQSELRIMYLVAYQMLISVYSQYEYQSTKVILTVDEYEFEATTQNLSNLGYRQLEFLCQKLLNISSKEKEEILLPPLKENQTLEVKDVEFEAKKTQPPKHFNESKLLEAMEKCKVEEDNQELNKVLKDSQGLGTPATRANIIEKIIASGFVKREKNKLIATEKAHQLMSVLPNELKTPKLTAEWEEKLEQIAKGQLNADLFMIEIESFVRQFVISEKEKERGVEFKSEQHQEKENLGNCPRCQKPVYESEKNFYCSNRDCKFALWKEDKFFMSQSKKITKSIAKAFLTKGEVKLTKLKSKKTGNTYDATIKMELTDKYTNFKLVFQK